MLFWGLKPCTLKNGCPERSCVWDVFRYSGGAAAAAAGLLKQFRYSSSVSSSADEECGSVRGGPGCWYFGLVMLDINDSFWLIYSGKEDSMGLNTQFILSIILISSSLRSTYNNILGVLASNKVTGT